MSERRELEELRPQDLSDENWESISNSCWKEEVQNLSNLGRQSVNAAKTIGKATGIGTVAGGFAGCLLTLEAGCLPGIVPGMKAGAELGAALGFFYFGIITGPKINEKNLKACIANKTKTTSGHDLM